LYGEGEYYSNGPQYQNAIYNKVHSTGKWSSRKEKPNLHEYGKKHVEDK